MREVPERPVISPTELLTPIEVAEILRSSVDYVWHLCRLPEIHGEFLKHLRKGNRILIRRQDLTVWIAAQVRGGE